MPVKIARWQRAHSVAIPPETVKLAHPGKGAVDQGRATALETQHMAGVFSKALPEQCPG